MSKFKKWLHKIYILRDLKRYNNSFHIKDESVAEHSFFVSSITLKLHEMYDFNLEHALIMAITHDESEIDVTDIPHNVKQAYPFVAKAIKVAENLAFKENCTDRVFQAHLELERHISPEALVVELADVLSCIQYSSTEMLLGNKGYMKTVYEESVRREKLLVKKLRGFKR